MMIPMNPIVAILHNLKTDRYHPILFDEHPYPGPYSDDKPRRHKSSGHHTRGYDTREAAVEGAKGPEMGARMKEVFGIEPRYSFARDIAWDGDAMPAMTMHFIEQDGELKIAF